MNNNYCVYWIHIKEHTNLIKEGYIGVSKNFNKRKKGHIKSCKNQKHENPILTRAYNKYGYENILFDIILVGDKNYCFELEEKLRPEKYIGWNINKGGIAPPIHYGDKNPSKRPEIRKILSEQKLGDKNPRYGKSGSFLGKTHSEESNEKNRLSHIGKKRSIETHKKIMNTIALRDFTHSEKSRENFRNAAKNRIKLSCIYCKKTGTINNMKRYHFDNCKLYSVDE